MAHARLYLRASTKDQDAERAKAALEAFAAERGLDVVGRYSENESGATLQRPELFRLLRDSKPGDVLLVEQVDRLSRLTDGDWCKLRRDIDARQVRVIALDLPTSWSLAGPADEFSQRMHGAINGMMLDMLAAIARKDYSDRRRRQAEGIAKLQAAGGYHGKPEDVERNAAIEKMLRAGLSWNEVIKGTGCARGTVAKVAARMRDKVALLGAKDQTDLEEFLAPQRRQG